MATFWDCLGNIKSRTLKINSRIRKQNSKPMLLKTTKAYVDRSSYNSSNIKQKAWNQVGGTDFLRAESYTVFV